MTHALDHYTLLGNTGLRVSPFCLGTMTFGTEWGWGADEQASREMFDIYADRGGNFIDTANAYTNGTSEEMVGKFAREKGRDNFVIATKFTGNMNPGDPNAGGNHRKAIRSAVEGSLKRLDTDYIDLLWLHMWEARTPWQEIMRSLDDLVSQGKVLYIGVSDTPAWQVSRANMMAEMRGWESFCALQVEYSLRERTPERDLIPMARELGLGVTPWSPLASGLLTGKYARTDFEDAKQPDPMGGTRKDVIQAMNGVTDPQEIDRVMNTVEVVKTIAGEVNASPAQVALRWCLDQPGVTSPILGASKPEQLKDNLDAIQVRLSTDQLQRLHDASAVPMGFPHDFLLQDLPNGFVDGECQIDRPSRHVRAGEAPLRAANEQAYPEAAE